MIAVYPGSFDPITLGHVDIIQRISPLFSQVHVLVAESQEKTYMFSPEERIGFVEAATTGLSNIRVHSYAGLTVDFAKEVSATCIVRGIRAISDFEYEMTMANMNKKLAPELETIVVFASPQFHYVSSRLVKEIAKHGGNLKDLVPTAVFNKLNSR